MFSTRRLPSITYHQAVASVSRPPSLVRSFPPTAFSAWRFFTGAFICQGRVNIVDGTNIVNLLEEWSRLDSISADKSREIYSEAAPLCWKSRVLEGLLVESSEGCRVCSRWYQSDPSVSVLFCHFPHFCPLNLKRAPFPLSIKRTFKDVSFFRTRSICQSRCIFLQCMYSSHFDPCVWLDVLYAVLHVLQIINIVN